MSSMRKRLGLGSYQWESSDGTLTPVVMTLFQDGPAFLLTFDDGRESVDRKIHFVSPEELDGLLPDKAYHREVGFQEARREIVSALAAYLRKEAPPPR
jgi:hypothetical protein